MNEFQGLCIGGPHDRQVVTAKSLSGYKQSVTNLDHKFWLYKSVPDLHAALVILMVEYESRGLVK